MEDNPTEYAHNENAINIRNTTKYANMPFFIGQAHPKIGEKCRVFFFFAGFSGPFLGPDKNFFSGANRCPTNYSSATQKNNTKKNLAV